MPKIYHTVLSNCNEQTDDLGFLSDISPSEISWDEHRANAEDMAVLYNRDVEFTKYAVRINGCSGYLKFKRSLVLSGTSLPCLPMAEVIKNACHDVPKHSGRY